MKLGLVNALARGAFLIDERALNTYLPLVVNVLTGAQVNSQLGTDGEPIEANHMPFAIVGAGAAGKAAIVALAGGVPSAPEQSVVAIPIRGAVMKEDYCGSPGTSTIMQWVKEADRNPNVAGIVLVIDSPGGAVNGTGELADTLANLSKPVVTFAEGLVASAGYWLASPTNRIVASHATAEIGSIGTCISLTDFSAFYEKYGVKQHYINADSSPDKNQSFLDALKGEYGPIKKEILNPTNELFMQAVKNNRAGKLKLQKNQEPLTGKIYLATEAMELGLIDSIGTIEDAAAQVMELSSTTQTHSTHMKVQIKTAWKGLMGFLGLTAPEGSESVDHDITSEQLEDLNSQVTELATLRADKTRLEGELKTANTKVETLTTKVTELEAEVETLGKQAGARGADPNKKEGHEGTGGDATEGLLTDADLEAAAMREKMGIKK